MKACRRLVCDIGKESFNRRVNQLEFNGLPIFCTDLFLHHEDCHREQDRRNTALIIHREFEGILHNEQCLCFDNKSQQDILRGRDDLLSRYNRRNCKVL